jgi:hypothetical protein
MERWIFSVKIRGPQMDATVGPRESSKVRVTRVKSDIGKNDEKSMEMAIQKD